MIEQCINVPVNDVKLILAKYFGVDEKNVIKNQYSFTIIGGKIPKEEPESVD
jgi:hypothetical protein